MSSARCTAIATIAAVLAALAAPVAAAEDPLVQRGRDLVQRNCAQCHAVGPRDVSLVPNAPAFRDLHERYEVENLQEALAEGILTGHPAMPEFRFTPQEITAILFYLKSLEPRGRAAAPGLKPRPARTP